MKIYRNLAFRRQDWAFPPLTMRLTGISGRYWFFGLLRLKDDPKVSDRKTWDRYYHDYGPGYDRKK